MKRGVEAAWVAGMILSLTQLKGRGNTRKGLVSSGTQCVKIPGSRKWLRVSLLDACTHTIKVLGMAARSSVNGLPTGWWPSVGISKGVSGRGAYSPQGRNSDLTRPDPIH